MNLLIVSHVVHYRHKGGLYAYGPYAREIGVWTELFSPVTIAAPCVQGPPPGDATRIDDSVAIAPMPRVTGGSFAARIHSALWLPAIVIRLARLMLRAGAIHVRCPGNLGAVAALMAPLFTRRLVAKYAAQWPDFQREPWTARFQKRVLGSRWFRGPVTVYGTWPRQPAHIVPFFTSSLDDAHIERARRAAAVPRFGAGPLRVLYTGRISRHKNVDVLIDAVAECRSRGVDLVCEIVGDGPERVRLAGRTRMRGLDGAVTFTGPLPFEELLGRLERSDVLVLVSETEGWPKSIAEAMAFGLLCVGADHGFTREMLRGRGLVVPRGDAAALAATLCSIAADPARFDGLRLEAAEWAARFSLSGLREALAGLLAVHWGAPLEGRRVPAPEIACDIR